MKIVSKYSAAPGHNFQESTGGSDVKVSRTSNNAREKHNRKRKTGKVEKEDSEHRDGRQKVGGDAAGTRHITQLVCVSSK